MRSADDEELVAAADDATVAFDAMRRQLALLTSAVERFASRQEAITAFDYGPDLEKVAARMANVGNVINVLAGRPAIALTPVEMARQIEIAGKTMRQSDHVALDETRQVFAQATRELDGVIARRARMHVRAIPQPSVLAHGGELAAADKAPCTIS